MPPKAKNEELKKAAQVVDAPVAVKKGKKPVSPPSPEKV